MKFKPQDQVFWNFTQPVCKPLHKDLQTDVVIIGGGMAGLTAAQTFIQKGLTVALLEQYYCGGGASGKSSGFITPDSELSLWYFIQTFGPEKARALWEFVCGGVNHIEDTIKKYSLSCDYKKQDTLVVASSTKGFTDDVLKEHMARKELNYQSTLYQKDAVNQVLGSSSYFGGVRYPNTFGINAFLYCQEVKAQLVAQGALIFEETPVLEIIQGGVITQHARVTAKNTIVCADRFIPQLGKLTQEIYQAQTFLIVTAPLQESQIKQIFPQEPLMVWDTDLIYTYYRMFDSNRLLVGGASLLQTYTSSEYHNNVSVFKKLSGYIENKFNLTLEYEYIWPGLIGISKDLRPIAGFDKDMPNVYYVGAAAGLPWAAALGKYSAQRIVDNKTDFDDYFNPHREYPISGLTQRILGKKITFALCNIKTLMS